MTQDAPHSTLIAKLKLSRAQGWRLLKVAFYAAAGALFVFLTAVLVLIAQGYDYDFRTGELHAQGMVMLDSMPRGAAVYINDEALDRTTPRRRLLAAGSHHFRLQHPDYRTWEKTVPIVAGQVTLLQYPLLILNSIVTENLQPLEHASDLTPSPNGRRAVFSPDGIGVWLLDTRSSEVAAVYELPAALADTGVRLERFIWSNDNTRLLAAARNGNERVFLVVDTANPERSLDLTALHGISSGHLYFSSGSWQELYWLERNNLRLVDLAAAEISANLAANVSDLVVGPSDVYYVNSSGGHSHISRLLPGGGSETAVAGLPQANYKLAILESDSVQLFAVLDTGAGQVTLYDAADELPPRPINASVSELLVSPEGRFLLMRDGRDFVVYDSTSRFLQRFQLPAAIANIAWAGKFHLSGVMEGAAVLFEFDGANLEEIVNAVDGSSVVLDPGATHLYSIGTSAVDEGPVLQVSRLRN